MAEPGMECKGYVKVGRVSCDELGLEHVDYHTYYEIGERTAALWNLEQFMGRVDHEAHTLHERGCLKCGRKNYRVLPYGDHRNPWKVAG